VEPFLIKAIYHEAKLCGVPITLAINDLLTKVLIATQGMHYAREETSVVGRISPSLPEPKTKLVGNCFWREGHEAALGPERRGRKGVAGERGAEGMNCECGMVNVRGSRFN